VRLDYQLKDALARDAACDVLGVSANGYCEHLRRKHLDMPAKPGASARMSDERLMVEIRCIHAKVRQEYG
jgi:putative transposase